MSYGTSARQNSRGNDYAHQRGNTPAPTPSAKGTPKVPTVRIPNILPVRTGSLLALCTVEIGGLEVHKCRLIRQDGQKTFFSPPQETWTDAEGQRRYKAIVVFPKHWNEAILAAILAKWQEETGEGV